MKYFATVSIIALFLVAGLSCQSDKSPKAKAQTKAKTAEDKPLLLNDEPLLLSDEGDAGKPQGADNSRCHVCHINFAQEELAVTHAKAGIGCPRCHGNSDAHIADESWASGGNGTPPDHMYPKNTINAFCMGCHTKDKIKGSQHEAIVAGTSDKVCTDCHGKHRLAKRKCIWK